jgi:hypothetical protein
MARKNAAGAKSAAPANQGPRKASTKRRRAASEQPDPAQARILLHGLSDLAVADHVDRQLSTTHSGDLAGHLLDVQNNSLAVAVSLGFDSDDSTSLVMAGLRKKISTLLEERHLEGSDLIDALKAIGEIAARESDSDDEVSENGASPAPLLPPAAVVKRHIVSSGHLPRIILTMSLSILKLLDVQDGDSTYDLAVIEEAWQLALKLGNPPRIALDMVSTAWGQVLALLATRAFIDPRAAALAQKLSDGMDRFHPANAPLPAGQATES